MKTVKFKGPDHQASAPLRVRELLAGKQVLVTGITGFLGKVWLAMVLETVPDLGKVWLIVRPRRGETAGERVREVLERSPAFRTLRDRLGRDFEAFIDARIEVLEGDLKQPMCGLDEETVARVAASVDATMHVAGLTDFQPEPMEAINVNLNGSMHMADLTARLRDPLMVHVSTCFVAGNQSGDIAEQITAGRSPNGTLFDVAHEVRALESVVETASEAFKNPYSYEARNRRVELGAARATALGWPNLYTYSKGLTEHALAQRDDVRVVTVRPSIIECARSYPFQGWNEGINTSGPLAWLSGGFVRQLPMAGDLHFDVVPVDTVSRAMTLALAAALDGTGEEVYQACSGDLNPVFLERIVDMTSLAYRKHYRRHDATPMERAVLRHLDVVPSGNDPSKLRMLPAVHAMAGGLRDLVGKFNVKKHVPERWRKDVGEKISEQVLKAYTQLTMTDRMLRRIRGIYDIFRPFVFENNYHFLSGHLAALNARLAPDERDDFSFDIESLDWRDYWIDVQMPGLMKWSFPLMRGQKAPIDPPREEQLLELEREAQRGRGARVHQLEARAASSAADSRDVRAFAGQGGAG